MRAGSVSRFKGVSIIVRKWGGEEVGGEGVRGWFKANGEQRTANGKSWQNATMRSKIDNWKALKLKLFFVVTKLPISHFPLPIESERRDANGKSWQVYLVWAIIDYFCNVKPLKSNALRTVPFIGSWPIGSAHHFVMRKRDAHHHKKVTLKA